jgi:hypothetical protein
LAYLEKQRTNDIIKRNSNLQTFAIYLTVLLTTVTLIITLSNVTSNDQTDKLQTHIREQTRQIHKLQIELSEATNLHFHQSEGKKNPPKQP